MLDQDKLNCFATGEKYSLDSLIFASQNNCIKDVMVNGQWVIENHQHPLEQNTQNRFSDLLAKLSS